jgi:hypothetical protein
VLGVQVDLVLGAVQPEADRTVGLAAVEVVDENSLDLMGHLAAPFRYWFWCIRVDNPGPGGWTATPVRPCSRSVHGIDVHLPVIMNDLPICNARA